MEDAYRQFQFAQMVLVSCLCASLRVDDLARASIACEEAEDLPPAYTRVDRDGFDMRYARHPHDDPTQVLGELFPPPHYCMPAQQHRDGGGGGDHGGGCGGCGCGGSKRTQRTTLVARQQRFPPCHRNTHQCINILVRTHTSHGVFLNNNASSMIERYTVCTGEKQVNNMYILVVCMHYLLAHTLDVHEELFHIADRNGQLQIGLQEPRSIVIQEVNTAESFGDEAVSELQIVQGLIAVRFILIDGR